MTAYSAGRMSISPAVYVPPLSQFSDDHSPSPPPHHTVVEGGGEAGACASAITWTANILARARFSTP